jgi:putative flippase GtrA
MTPRTHAWIAGGGAYRLARYVVAGTINTALSQLVYLGGLALGLSPGVAYAIAFAAGIAIGYLLHGRVVFRAAPQRVHLVTFPAACLARLALSEVLLHAFIDAGMTAGWAGLVVSVAMVPVGYVLTRLAFTAPWRELPASRRAGQPTSAASGAARGDDR